MSSIKKIKNAKWNKTVPILLSLDVCNFKATTFVAGSLLFRGINKI